MKDDADKNKMKKIGTLNEKKDADCVSCCVSGGVASVSGGVAYNFTDADAHFETEKKFLVKMPDITALLSAENCKAIRIEQIYLTGEKGVAERIRRSEINGKTLFTHTIKRDISGITREEREREILKNEYEDLRKNRADESLNAINKTRYAFDFSKHTVELDVYDFCSTYAICEVELKDENEPFALPPFISVIRDVSAEKEFSNYSIARKIPVELQN